MKRKLLITIIFSIALSLFCIPESNKNIESKIAEYEAGSYPDSTLYQVYEEGYNEFKVSNPVKAIQYLKKLAILEDKKGNESDKYGRYVRIGQLYHQLGMHNLALEYLLEPSSFFLKEDDLGNLAWLYSDIGNVYFALEQYDIAEPYYRNGLKMMQDLGDGYGQSVMHNNIALCQLSAGKIEDSFKNLEIGLKLREEINNTYAVYHSKYLLGKNYTLSGQFEKGYQLYKEIWDQYTYDEIVPQEAVMLKANAGLAIFGYFHHINDLEQAEKFLNDSIILVEQIGDYFTLGTFLAQKAQFYVEQGRNEEALAIFHEIFDFAYQEGFSQNAHFYADWLVRLNFRLGRLQESKKYYEIYTTLTDSLINQRSSEKLVKLHSIVQNHMKEVENVQLKQKQIYSQRLLILVTAFLIIIIILVILMYFKDKYNLTKIRNLANASSEAIVVHDRGNIIDSNNQFKRMFYDSNSKVTNILDLSPESEKEKIQKMILANEKTVIKSHLITSKNKVIDTEISSRPYIYRSKEVRVAVIQDTTRVNDFIRSIQQAEDKLRVLNTTKDKLFSIIAHDLKNPFNAIIGFTNLMKDSWREINPNEVDEMIAMINESSISAHTLLENLLDWARIQTENLQFEPSSIKVDDTISEAISLLSAQIKLKNISIFIDCPSDIFAYADSRMFSTILRNLLSNAVKFTNQKGEISFKVKQDDTSTIIIIDDDGVGMNKEQLAKMLNFDLNNSNLGTSNEKGTGLGLILCKELIDYHKGNIEIESELNIGTTITITLPKKLS